MSPPGPAERLAALAALTSSGAEPMPPAGPAQSALALVLVGRARRAGVTWARIGAALGAAGGPAGAKHQARLLARTVSRGRVYEFPDDRTLPHA